MVEPLITDRSMAIEQVMAILRCVTLDEKDIIKEIIGNIYDRAVCATLQLEV